MPRWRQKGVEESLMGFRKNGLSLVWRSDQYRVLGLFPMTKVKVICGDRKISDYVEKFLIEDLY